MAGLGVRPVNPDRDWARVVKNDLEEVTQDAKSSKQQQDHHLMSTEREHSGTGDESPILKSLGSVTGDENWAGGTRVNCNAEKASQGPQESYNLPKECDISVTEKPMVGSTGPSSPTDLPPSVNISNTSQVGTEEKRHFCKVCGYRCNRADRLKDHMRSHTGEKPYNCDICDFKCSRAGILKRHMRVHTGEKPFACDMCDYRCSETGTLKAHRRTHTGEKPYACDLCNYKCAQASAMWKHKKTHAGENPYSCDQCSYRCTQNCSLRKHKKTHLVQDSLADVDEQEGTATAETLGCGSEDIEDDEPDEQQQSFGASGERMGVTVRSAGVSDRLPVPDCSRPESEDEDWPDGVGVECKLEEMSRCVEEPSHNVCENPTSVMSDHVGVTRVRSRHKVEFAGALSGPKDVACDAHNASQPLDNANLPLGGLTVRHLTRPYGCELCEFRGKYRSDLEAHMRTHTGEKPYACAVCDYRGTHSSHLKYHMRTHTGEKPFVCDICGYRCIHAGRLKDHMMSHTGEKPYNCDICDFKCSRTGILKRHIRMHTGEKPYACDMCDYRCSETGTLKAHRRTHTGEKPYSCDCCSYRCVQASALRKHKKTHAVQSSLESS